MFKEKKGVKYLINSQLFYFFMAKKEIKREENKNKKE